MEKNVIVISGERGAGKSRYCLELLEQSEKQSLICRGIISPAVYSGNMKTAFYTMDPETKEQRLCGFRTDEARTIGCWQMDPDVLIWGNQLLEKSCPCDILFIDELGPLEFKKKQGYMAAFDVLQKGTYGTAYVVIRPECLDEFKQLIPEFQVIVM